MLKHRFIKGVADQTLFVLKNGNDILTIQIYVDNIIFGAMNKDLWHKFEKLMQDEFEIFLIGELKYFLWF